MKLLGLRIEKEDTFIDIHKKYETIYKKLSNAQKNRPWFEDRTRMAAKDDNVLVPVLPFSESFLTTLSLESDILRTALHILKRKLFKRGVKIVSKTDTGNLLEEAKIKYILKKANKNGQTLLAVLKQVEEDLNVHDDAYLICTKEYFYNFQGRIIDEMTKPVELIRGSPERVRLIIDHQGNAGLTPEGKKVFVSPANRAATFSEEQAVAMNYIDSATGKEMRQAYYRAEIKDGDYVYYFKDEILHISKWNKSMGYGYSNIFACWMKILTLIYQDRHLMTAYKKGRPPRGILTLGTTNYESTKKAWEEAKAEARNDPHAIVPLLYENTSSARNLAQWLDLMPSLNEMQYVESRNEMRRAILALWGITPVFSGDVETSGGLNNEGLQMEISNETIEEGQKLYNEEVFPWILEQLGINETELILEEPEEKDELEDERILQLKIQNAVQMKQMGFDVTYFPKEQHFEYSEKATQPMQQFGPFGQDPAPQKPALQNPLNQKQVFKKKLSKEDHAIALLKNEIELSKQTFTLTPELEKKFLETLKESLWDKTFEGLAKTTSDTVKQTILAGIVERQTLQQVIDKITDLGVDKAQAETIARTEATAIQNSAREFFFKEIDPKAERKVYWLTAQDNRVSPVCKEIHELTKKGVSMKQLKKTIQDVARRHGLNPRELVPHPLCRSSINFKI